MIARSFGEELAGFLQLRHLGHIEQLSDWTRRPTAVANFDRSQDFMTGRAGAVTLRFDQAQTALVSKSENYSFLDGVTNSGVHNLAVGRNRSYFFTTARIFARKKRAPTSSRFGALNLNPAASYSSIRRPYSTIGAGGLNGRVRDGIGCDTSAIATGNF